MTAEKKKDDVQLDEKSILTAINGNYAVIEFYPDGTIIHANDAFLQGMGYKISEIQNKHHRMFCEPEYAESFEYKKFWKDLAEGETKSGSFQRFKSDGSEIWLTASYTPIENPETGKVEKVIKFAQDHTEQILKAQDSAGKLAAISKSQAVIEFELDGTILWANDNFCAATGYSLEEIKGKHHRIFCEPEYANSPEYRQFWQKLGRGEFDSGEYKRITSSGEDLWINASYNPIMDPHGRPFKVVKFASDITEQKMRNANLEGIINAVDKSQAVIEFNLDGTVITANENFCATVGYSLDEIKGKHHRIFCDPAYTSTSEYEAFWKQLNQGTFDTGEYKRFAKNGDPVWINASYNPIRDVEGNVYKVVKFATDLTKEKLAYENLVNSFDEATQSLLESSSSLSTTAEQLKMNAEGTLEKSRDATLAIETVNQGVMTVGSSTEEMNSSIKEISSSALEASTQSNEAKTKSERTNEIMAELDQSSDQIGAVIKMISSIAQQTNLLALNATIEAARAGEAGKGFAVVANEVKELAKQTAKATDDIASQISSVQDSTKNSVTAISEISQIIDKLNSIASSTAAAVEEQSATTSEVSRVVSEATKGVDDIMSLISNVNAAAQESSTGANETLKSANELRELSMSLKELVEKARK
ncbi:MAG: PAS domain-containing methyl-accepting chemotaxis protein [Bdellovibrionota bacterium]|nr:PAS domain-containing methyl-accepting chemotaxis protein [Bdellovibrionota bacterium]